MSEEVLDPALLDDISKDPARSQALVQKLRNRLIDDGELADIRAAHSRAANEEHEDLKARRAEQQYEESVQELVRRVGPSEARYSTELEALRVAARRAGARI